MATKVDIWGVPGPPNAGKLQRARLYNPDNSTNSEMALAEENNSGTGLGVWNGTATPTLANALTDPYTYEVREVITQDTAGFDAATAIVRRTRGLLGWVKNNVLLRADPYIDAAVSSISGGGGSVSGAWTLTITVTAGGLPVVGATVRVTLGASTEAYLTDSNGQVFPTRDNGTYSVAVKAAGFTQNAPVPATVAITGANNALAVLMTATTLAAYNPATEVLGQLAVYDVNDGPAVGIRFQFLLASTDGTTGRSFVADPLNARLVLSGGGGALSTNFLINSVYYGRRELGAIGSGTWGAWVKIVTGAVNFQIPELLGKNQ